MIDPKEQPLMQEQPEVHIAQPEIEDHAHRDPITGAPGAHPVGAGLGAISAGTAGAAIGAAAGPVGALAGVAIGAFVGGLIGKGVAEGIDPTEESAFWRDNYRQVPYYDASLDFDTHYEPAYRYGWETRRQYHDRSYDEVESDLAKEWENSRADSDLGWEKAKHAVKDAWHRIEKKLHR